MPSGHEQIGEVVRKGILLFGSAFPLPAPTLVAAVSAAVITKLLDQHARRVSEVLSLELTLPHVSRIEPGNEQLALFFARNPLFPELEQEFGEEIRTKNVRRLRELYPVVHSALVLQRQVPVLLYGAELESRAYRSMALQYERLLRGYGQVQKNSELRKQSGRFATELWEVLEEIYGAIRAETKSKKNQFAFEVMDYILEVSRL
jgi:hypothetical protein